MTKNNEYKEVNTKNYTYYFDNIINMNDFNPKNIKADAKSYKDILIFYTGQETLNGVKPLYITFNKINGYIEDDNGSRYLTFIPVGEIKQVKGNMNKIKYLNDLENNDSGKYDKCMKIRFNSDGDSSFKQELETHNVGIIITSVFYDNHQYYQQVFSDEHLHKLGIIA